MIDVWGHDREGTGRLHVEERRLRAARMSDHLPNALGLAIGLKKPTSEYGPGLAPCKHRSRIALAQQSGRLSFMAEDTAISLCSLKPAVDIV